MAEYTSSQDFTYTTPSGEKKTATATYRVIYDAQKQLIYKHELTIDPCEILADPQASEQLKPKITKWNVGEYWKAREAANMYPGLGGVYNDPEKLAEGLYDQAARCATAPEVSGNDAIKVSIDQTGKTSSALVSDDRPSLYGDIGSTESDESTSTLNPTSPPLVTSQANPKSWRWPDNLPPPNTRDGLLWYRNNRPPPAYDPLLQGGRQYASALDDTRMASAAPNSGPANSGGDAGYGVPDRTAISALAPMDAPDLKPAGLPFLRPTLTAVSTPRSIAGSGQTPSIWDHIFLQVAAVGRPGRDDWES